MSAESRGRPCGVKTMIDKYGGMQADISTHNSDYYALSRSQYRLSVIPTSPIEYTEARDLFRTGRAQRPLATLKSAVESSNYSVSASYLQTQDGDSQAVLENGTRGRHRGVASAANGSCTLTRVSFEKHYGLEGEDC